MVPRNNRIRIGVESLQSGGAGTGLAWTASQVVRYGKPIEPDQSICSAAVCTG